MGKRCEIPRSHNYILNLLKNDSEVAWRMFVFIYLLKEYKMIKVREKERHILEHIFEESCFHGDESPSPPTHTHTGS